MAKREPPEFRYVYFIESESLGMVKIGLADNPRRRLRELQVGSPDKLNLRGVLLLDDAPGYEASMHLRFAEERSHGEWFRKTDRLEEFMVGLMDPEEDRIKICLKPTEPDPRSITIWRLEGEEDDTFMRRFMTVAHALHPTMYEAPEPGPVYPVPA
jgi:hypothetical protein